MRRRAVGTRDRIIAHLALVAEVTDGAGMASPRLAEAVGYPGSSVAFAQLLSGMERDGLISREVRGKRTYRITLSSEAPARAAAGTAPTPDTVSARNAVSARSTVSAQDMVAMPAAFPGAIDYDELADRVILRLLRRLTRLNRDDLATLERMLASGEVPAGELNVL